MAEIIFGPRPGEAEALGVEVPRGEGVWAGGAGRFGFSAKPRWRPAGDLPCFKGCATPAGRLNLPGFARISCALCLLPSSIRSKRPFVLPNRPDRLTD